MLEWKSKRKDMVCLYHGSSRLGGRERRFTRKESVGGGCILPFRVPRSGVAFRST
jgi:hypothetical protein